MKNIHTQQQYVFLQEHNEHIRKVGGERRGTGLGHAQKQE
jgi:hypothetical protein